MIDSIIAFSVKNKLIVGLMVLLLIAAGIYSATRLPVDAVPDITSNQVLVITVSPSLAAPEVERLITAPAERVMASLPKLKEMRSISRFGLSNVTVVFDDDVDIYLARQQVSERLSQLKGIIPPSIGEPEMGPVSTGLGEVYQYYVVPKPGYETRYTLTELRTMQEWIVRRQLLGVPGVADVSSLGGKLKQYQVVVNPLRLKAMNVTLDELFNAVQQNNENTGGAYIEKGPNAYYIRTEGLAQTGEDLRNIPVKNVNGIPLKVSDVADVNEGDALRFGAMVNNKYGEVAGAVVLMLKGANAMDVVKKVKERVEEIKTRLPEGVTIMPYYQRSKMVGNAISTVEHNLIEGALIVVFVLVIFLGNLRSGLVVASVIPLAMLFALIMMNVFHVSANLMSLGALDFGLIVDGAVIIVEGVMHRFKDKVGTNGDKGFSKDEVDDEVKQSTSRLMNAAIFGQVIILIVYMPILSLQGIEGKMFRPMAETVAFALVGAFILSLTYVPMMTALTINRKPSDKKSFADKLMAAIHKRYEPVLLKAIHYPKTVMVIGLVLCGLAYIVFNGLGGEFIPQLEEGDLALDARFLPGTSLSQTIKGMKLASAELKKFPEVQQVTCRVGSAEIPTDPMSLEQCDIFVTLNDKSDWKTAHDYPTLQDTMSKRLAQIPGLNVGVEYPVQMRFNELISGSKQDVVVKIFGDDLQQLSKLSGRLTGIISHIKGAVDVTPEKVVGLPQMVIHYNRSKMAQYNVNISQVNHIINAVFAGQKAGNVYEGERQFDVVVRLADSARSNLNNIGQLQVNTAGGIQVPLQQLATIGIKDGPNQIQRDDGQRRISVSFNVRGRDVQSVVKDLQQQVQQKMKLPPAYRFDYGGQFENLNSAKSRLAIAVPAALFIIFILLFFAFGQLREALIVFSAIPLSATGGVFALWIRGMDFSISAGVGFIALFGVAVLNGIVLISEFNRLKKEGENDVEERIRKGTDNRLRPVLMTATVASLGFLPMAVSTHAGAEVQRPLATVVIGGLITATLLTLVVLPALYRQFAAEKSEKPESSGGDGLKQAAGVILLLFSFQLASAQVPSGKPVSATMLINKAIEGNNYLRAAQSQTQAARANIGTAFDLPKTQVSYDIGRLNSPYTDDRIGALQTLNLPFYYTSLRNLLKAESSLTAVQEDIIKNQVAFQVRDIYLQIATNLAKLKLLDSEDSVYHEVIRLEQLRFKLGESSRINLTSAEAKAGMLKNQRRQTETEIRVLQNRWQVLLNTTDLYLSQDVGPPKWYASLLPDSSAALQHPEVRQAKQQLVVSDLRIRTARSRALPEVTLGYNNQTFVGVNPTNTNNLLTRADRFSSYLVGVNVPLFFKPYRAAIRAASFQQKAASYNYSGKQVEWLGQWKQAYQRYTQQLQALSYYENTAAQQANELLRTATLSFKNGGISYLEWANFYAQAVQLRNERLDALLQLNQSVNTLWYYQNDLGKP